MYNDLFSVFGITVHGYGLMIGLGVVASLLLSWHRAKVRGLDEDTVSTVTILVVILGFAGGKIFFLLTHWDFFLSSPGAALGSEGFVVYGGILTGFLSAWLYLRKKEQPFLRWTDLLLPGVAIAQGFGRVGCFLAGCCYGKPTDSCLGVTFPAGSFAPAGVSLWPTQLFSAAGNLMIAAFLLLADRKQHREGALTGWYLLLYGVGRFLVEFLRNDDRGWVGALSSSQFFSFFAVAAAAVLFARIRKKEPEA